MTGPARIYEALSAVMGDVQGIRKGQRVTEGPARFSFRGVDDVVNAVGPVLREHSVIVVPHEVVSVEHERYTTKSGALMDGVTIVIRWRFYAIDGSFVEASSAGQSADAGDKAIPKAHSVAYRTVLLQALCIPTDEPDPDTTIHERTTEQRPAAARGAKPRPAEKPAEPAKTAADMVRIEAEKAGYVGDDMTVYISTVYDGRTLDDLTTDELKTEWKTFHEMAVSKAHANGSPS